MLSLKVDFEVLQHKQPANKHEGLACASPLRFCLSWRDTIYNICKQKRVRPFALVKMAILYCTLLLRSHDFMNTGMLENLYGKHAAALYAQAADFNKTARFYYMKAEDAYYLANAQASYDDWRRARRQWDYFYRYVNFIFYFSMNKRRPLKN